MADGPVMGDRQAGAAEQAAGVALLRLPGHGSVGQVALGPLAGPVLAQPLAQLGPGGEESLVADRDGIAAVGAGVGGQQPSLNQGGERRALRRSLRSPGWPGPVGAFGELGHGGPPAGVGGALAQADQPQEQPLGRQLAIHVEAGVDRVGGPGDSPVDTASGLVGGHGQPAALPVPPGLLQRVSQQRQPASL